MNIPGLKEAIEAERFERATAFVLELESICGVPVLPMNIWHVMALDVIGSPFMSRQDSFSHDDVTNFLWLLNPRYEPNALAKRWFYLTRCRKLPVEKVVIGIAKFITDAFAETGKSGESSRSYFSSAAGLVDILASEYGWGEREILRLPLKRAFQYQKAILRRLNPKVPLFNPSDGKIQEWINARNQ